MIPQKQASRSAKRLYRRIAREHEQLRADDKMIDNEVLTRLFKLIPARLNGRAVFDAGGGSGAFSQMLLERGDSSAVCLDISDEMRALARRRKKEAGLKKMRIVAGDLVNTGLKGKQFDIIIAVYSLPYVSEMERCFAEFARLLKPGGQLFVASDFYELKKPELRRTFIKYLLGDIKMTGIVQTKADYARSAEQNGFTMKRFFVLKKAHGLKIDPNYRFRIFVTQRTFGAKWVNKYLK
ncbi:MAG: class I SAM-dependent methyltransferase [Patescibacteria group bacterium]|nr:class I SAM-dependent methyltransferase [Patescibacteria group bacterium]